MYYTDSMYLLPDPIKFKATAYFLLRVHLFGKNFKLLSTQFGLVLSQSSDCLLQHPRISMAKS